jgi:hypothetical protein
MYFIRFLVHPKKNNHEYGKVEGAYANCWISSTNVVGAKKRARNYLDDWDWTIAKIDEVLITQLKDNIGSKTSLKYYREAERTGICVVLHKWTPRKAHKTKSTK